MALLSSAKFKKASFSGAEFKDVTFAEAEFQESADFSEASFKMNPKIDETIHDSISPDSLDSIGWAYRKSFLFGAGSFFGKAGEGHWNETEYAKASESFRNAKVEYDKEGKYDEAGKMYVREMDSIREQLRFWKGERLKWIWFWVLKHTCDYGEKPWRFIRWVGYIILFFAFLYMPIISRIPVISDRLSWWPFIKFKEYPFQPWIWSEGYLFNIMTSLYFSVVTFATLGFGGITPVSNVGKIAVIVEVLLGYLMFGVLITLVARKMTRS